jgi:outer membrane protein assembly factor BamE (lipoprotein component of BamABCDE complex)
MRTPFTTATRMLVLSVVLAGALAACITIGNDYPETAVDIIKPGTTTLDDVRKIFGNPVRTGLDDGKVTWTYMRYHANIAGDFDGKDLIVKFDDQNRVLSISYSSTDVAKPLKR